MSTYCPGDAAKIATKDVNADNFLNHKLPQYLGKVRHVKLFLKQSCITRLFR